MGCWSESCAFSGMEIAYDDLAFVVVMTRNKHFPDKWETHMPPILGHYDDYGGIELVESNSRFDLETGYNFKRPHSDSSSAFVYVRAEVFNFLPDMRDDDNKTLGEDRDAFLYDIQNQINAVIKQKHECEDLTQIPLSELQIKMSRYMEIDPTASRYLTEQLQNGKTDFREFLTFLGRAYVFEHAQVWLRKLIVPHIHGFQHGGDECVGQFYEHVLNLIKQKQQWV